MLTQHDVVRRRPHHDAVSYGGWSLDLHPADVRWPEPQTIARIELTFDTDRDNPLFSVLLGHPDRFVRHCVREYRILDSAGRVLARCVANHQTRNTVCLSPPITTEELRVELAAPGPLTPAALVEVRCYGAAHCREDLPLP